MKYVSSAIKEIKDFLKSLNSQKGEYLANYGIKQFWYVLNDYEIFKDIIQALLENHNDMEERIGSRVSGKTGIQPLLGDSKTIEEYVAVCLWTIKKISEQEHQLPPDDLYLITIGYIEEHAGANTYLKYNDRKNILLGTYIEPIILYLERSISLVHNRISVLKRYQLLCHNFDKDDIKKQKETDLTSEHLAKFLFNEGINNILTETNVKSGRMDAFIYDEKESIIIEGKIYDGDNKKTKNIYECISQVQARFGNIHFSDGYAVIYNKSDSKIEIAEHDGTVLDVPYWLLDGKKIFIFIIDLEDEILKVGKDWKAGIKVTKISKDNYLKSTPPLS